MFEGKDVTVLLANAGAGKAGWVEAIIPTPDGKRRFGDLKVGDYVFDRQGNPTKVLGVYPRGMMDAYRLTLSDGRSTICGLDHLWTVYRDYRTDKTETLELSAMLEEGIRKSDKRANRKLGKPKFYIPTHGVRCYTHKKIKVDPYVFGAFTGNGCLTEENLCISSADEETVKKVADILGFTYKKRSEFNYTWDFFVDGKRVKTTSLFSHCYAHEKYIPDEYKYNNSNVRLSLLQGLFDTDGSAVFDGVRLCASYSTVSKTLCDDVVELLESMGIVASVHKDNHVGKSTLYVVAVNCRNDWKANLFTLSRKRNVCLQAGKARRNYSRVAIRSVEKLDSKLEMQCIYVDNAEHLYQCENGIVTHNTSKLMNILMEELKERRPEEIAFVTFTKKGAEEGLSRACNKFNVTPDDLPYFRTLHSLTFHALNLKSNNVFGKIDERKFNKETGYFLNRCENNASVYASKDSKYLDFYDLERSGAVKSKQLMEADIEIGYYRQLVQKYEEYKNQHHLVDFFDCLIKYVQTGDSLPCKVIMCDECFSPETRVRMADMSVKEIKGIKVGDYVMGTNSRATRVSAIHRGVDTMYDVVSTKKKVLFTCNSAHLIEQRYGSNKLKIRWQHASEVNKNGIVHFEGVEKKVYPCRVIEKGKGEYVGITVEADDSLFVLENGAVVHNCQDITALQWQVIDKAFSKAEKIYLAGDENQCQPVGSKVLTKKGYRNIEDITSADSLITFAQRNYCYYGFKNTEYHPEVVNRHFEGDLVVVKTSNGVVNKFTPNHKMIVRWLNKDTTLQCVYLMQKGDKYRIGQCQIFNANQQTHFITRMRLEKAEKSWILRVCRNKEEALIWEQVYSSKFGIPQISWSKRHTTEMQNCVYAHLGDLECKATQLLISVKRSIDYPMFTLEKNNAKSGGTCLTQCEAINLVPEIMALPVFSGKSHADKNTLWQTFEVSREYYSGLVYSMNVPKYHTYVTEGGLTVHNCIFKYAGARPDYLIKFANKYPRIELKASYRLPKKVYELAKGIVNMIQEKTDKAFEFKEGKAEGNIYSLNELERLKNFLEDVKLENNKHCQWYLLARNNCYLSKYEKLLEENLIPYWNADGFFMGGEIMRRIKDYKGFALEGYRNEAKREQFRKKYGITDFSVPFYETNLFTEGRKWVYASYIEKYGLQKLEEMCKWNPQILVSTIHYVKGGEADNVAIMLDSTNRTYSEIYEDLDSELRVLYVGVTRAKENLYLIDSASANGYGKIIKAVKDEYDLDW